MGVEITTALLNRLWEILEAGETGTRCKVGNRIKFATRQGWLKEFMAKAPADFPQVEIEVGGDSFHSGYMKGPTFAMESAELATEVTFEIDRTELVTITVTTDRVDVGGINPVVEAVKDDLMRAGPRLGLSPLVVGFTGMRSRQRRQRASQSQYRYVTPITFTVQMQQNGRATITGEE